MAEYSFGTIGSGAMAEAIIKGVLSANLYNSKEILVSDINENRLVELNKQLGISTTLNNDNVLNKCKVVLLAVKPQHLNNVLGQINNSLPNKEKLIISIVAGIPIKVIEDYLKDTAIVRVMPNSPALIGQGMAALCKNEFATEQDLKIAENIFNSVGKTEIVEEDLLDAITGLSGSGPAYVYQFIEALADGGVLVGLPRAMAYKLAAQTVLGSAQMVLATGRHPGELKDQVTSPAGTTIQGVKALEKNKFRAAVMEAVEAGFLCSKKLGSKD